MSCNKLLSQLTYTFFRGQAGNCALGRIIKHFESLQYMVFWIDGANCCVLSAGKMWSGGVYWTTWKACS